MANLNNPRPRLYEAVPRKNTLGRTVDLIILFLFLSLLLYRFHSLSSEFPWLLAFICESWFTFVWILTINIKWNQLEYKTYEQTLLQWVSADELPSLDIFVTTADAVLEPPILTVNTVLSLLAVDYPSNKLACYVSDDGCSPLTFYSLSQASSFAQLWIPFCKKYNIHVRAPFRYFPSSEPTSTATMEFQHEWNMIKDEYEKLCKRIEEAAQRSTPCQLTGDFALFSNTERTNHPTIIKIISENKKRYPDSVPHLVYISREKRPKHPHHFKAGAMNVLTRVSGVMTNAPFILNVDCDMFVNNPQIVVQAMCLLIGVEDERDSAYVQCPQIFYDGLKDDPYGNQLVVQHHYLVHGIVGIQGPFYMGTGCFHRRKVIYGISPQNNDIKGKLVDSSNLHKVVGNSVDLTKSAAQILSVSNITMTTCQAHLSSSLEAAHKVAASAYEYGTGWGTKIGWMYGSTVEDALTGLTIQSRGWRSTYCTPDPPAFLGCAPTGGPSSMTQQNRWATGLLEILFTTKSPLLSTLFGKLQFRQCLAYTWICVWALRSIPEICYATLPAYCIITNSQCLPKVHETTFLIFIAVFMVYNLYTLWEYRQIGESTHAWWNNQRIWRVISMTAWLFGFLGVVLKLLRLSKTVFEVTKKEESDNSSVDDNTSTKNGGFTFDDSPIFVPGTTILLINITALTYGLLGLIRPPPPTGEGKYRSGIVEIMYSVCVVTCFWEFLKGLFGKGQYGIPLSTICKSGALTFLFLQFCIWTSTQA